jgi:alpha-3'-ketoglucosidase
MKTRILATVVLLPLSCKAQSQPPAPPQASATTQNTLTDAERSAGWRLLFDGRTTAGWRNYGKPTISDGWTVQDGSLTRTGAGGDIITTDQFRNFELSIDWKIEPGGNSGVFYRASEDSDEIYWNAPEMQVLDDAKHPDGKDRMTAAGAAYDLYPSPAGHVKPGGEWNTARLIVNGNHVEHWLNGAKLLEYELGSRDWDAKVAASKFKPHPHFGKNAQGHIGLQDHGNLVAFRNIKIRVLP